MIAGYAKSIATTEHMPFPDAIDEAVKRKGQDIQPLPAAIANYLPSWVVDRLGPAAGSTRISLPKPGEGARGGSKEKPEASKADPNRFSDPAWIKRNWTPGGKGTNSKGEEGTVYTDPVSGKRKIIVE